MKGQNCKCNGDQTVYVNFVNFSFIFLFVGKTGIGNEKVFQDFFMVQLTLIRTTKLKNQTKKTKLQR